MSILIFFVVLFILVLVHEWGHFIVAKKTGMRVDEFGIGFPPKIFGIKKGETEYTFNWLPIGGFVRIFGENKEAAFVETDESSKGRAFSDRPKWAQALVLVAGVVMNILFAWFLFSVTFMVGVQTIIDEQAATESSELFVIETLVDSPAAVIPTNSVIANISYQDLGYDNPLPSEFSRVVGEAEGNPVSITYTSDGKTETLSIAPVQGLVEGDPERYVLGASIVLIDKVSQPFLTAIWDGLTATLNGLVAITVGLYDLIAQAFVGDADFSQVAGPVGIVSMVGEAASFGFTALLTFTAIISLNLAVINMLPFPALDGGRLVFVAIEAVTRKEIPPEWAGRVNLVGFAILMLLMIAVTYNDILRL